MGIAVLGYVNRVIVCSVFVVPGVCYLIFI